MFAREYTTYEASPRYPHNNGQQTEREIRYMKTGEWQSADNNKGGADCTRWQIKTFRATLCQGENLEQMFVEYADADGFIFGDRAGGVFYEMTKDEFYDFAKRFAKVDIDTTTGAKKIRLNQQCKAQSKYLKARAEALAERNGKSALLATLNDIASEYECEVVESNEFAYYYEDNLIAVNLNDTDEAFLNFARANGLDERVSSFTISFLHELGHNETIDYCEEYEGDKDSLSLEEYFNLEEEYEATMWAIDYCEEHKDIVERIEALLRA